MAETTFRTLITAFTDFLTVAIHTILWERSIYPKTSFLSARKYNFPVKQNRHPKVCGWINDAVTAIEGELLKGRVHSVAVVIFMKDSKPLERFVFDVSRFPDVPVDDLDTLLQSGDADEPQSVLPIVDMEEQFRATLSKLTASSTSLHPAPEGSTFTVAIELKPEALAPVSHPQPWIPAQVADDEQGGAAARISTAKTTPLRAINAGEMKFEAWIEEAGGDVPDG
ncbi:hypothetical protein B0A48_09812 [Cryoendolithus antarcticus]|uniref:HORMA domain-containing protein n=1 Tax=Cryoendolithus antarcticus TaxID=1507870 RepID=A0A1V8T320_9PEZI|nr:hypothetical protein B0A48_09812 [Cryoendolithus antarcticus]